MYIVKTFFLFNNTIIKMWSVQRYNNSNIIYYVERTRDKQVPIQNMLLNLCRGRRDYNIMEVNTFTNNNVLA